MLKLMIPENSSKTRPRGTCWHLPETTEREQHRVKVVYGPFFLFSIFSIPFRHFSRLGFLLFAEWAYLKKITSTAILWEYCTFLTYLYNNKYNFFYFCNIIYIGTTIWFYSLYMVAGLWHLPLSVAVQARLTTGNKFSVNFLHVCFDFGFHPNS